MEAMEETSLRSLTEDVSGPIGHEIALASSSQLRTRVGCQYVLFHLLEVM